MKNKLTFLRGALIIALLALTACSRPTADFTLTFGGDIMLARGGEAIFQTPSGKINPWKEIKSEGVLISDWSFTPDFFLANLESPLGKYPSTTGDMNLCSDPAQIKVLDEGGVDVVSLANNHRNDCSADGPAVTSDNFDEDGILSTAMGDEPGFLNVSKNRVAVLAAEDVTGSLDVTALLSAIQAARQTAQVVVVSMHWGNEYQAGADDRQQALAQQIADAGADIIWGQHPHVLQKMEWLQSADGRQVLVMYSLGNLLADQWMLEDAKQTALVRLSFTDARLAEIEIIPLVMDRGSKTLDASVTDETRDMIFERLGAENLATDSVRVSLFSTK